MVDTVLLYPRSGYANRFQAMASSMLLAQDLGAEFRVCWEPDAGASASMEQVFAPDFVLDHSIDTAGAERLGDFSANSIPRGVTRTASTISVAGLDLGEQALMPGLRSSLEHGARTIVISAGGRFDWTAGAELTPDQRRSFEARRRSLYRSWPWHDRIRDLTETARLDRPPYVGVHLRYSDRNREAPWRRSIAPAVTTVARQAGVTDVFVASDTAMERRRWLEELGSRGWNAWSSGLEQQPRADPASVLGAIVDWRLLASSQGVVYFAASSFGEEAAVAAGDTALSIGLPASAARRQTMIVDEYARAALTYPRRHRWGFRGDRT